MISSVTVDVLKKVSCKFVITQVQQSKLYRIGYVMHLYSIYIMYLYTYSSYYIILYRHDIITKQGNSIVYAHYFEKVLLFWKYYFYIPNSIQYEATILTKILYIFVLISFRCFLFKIIKYIPNAIFFICNRTRIIFGWHGNLYKSEFQTTFAGQPSCVTLICSVQL